MAEKHYSLNFKSDATILIALRSINININGFRLDGSNVVVKLADGFSLDAAEAQLVADYNPFTATETDLTKVHVTFLDGFNT